MYWILRIFLGYYFSDFIELKLLYFISVKHSSLKICSRLAFVCVCELFRASQLCLLANNTLHHSLFNSRKVIIFLSRSNPSFIIIPFNADMLRCQMASASNHRYSGFYFSHKFTRSCPCRQRIDMYSVCVLHQVCLCLNASN